MRTCPRVSHPCASPICITILRPGSISIRMERSSPTATEPTTTPSTSSTRVPTASSSPAIGVAPLILCAARVFRYDSNSCPNALPVSSAPNQTHKSLRAIRISIPCRARDSCRCLHACFVESCPCVLPPAPSVSCCILHALAAKCRRIYPKGLTPLVQMGCGVIECRKGIFEHPRSTLDKNSH